MTDLYVGTQQQYTFSEGDHSQPILDIGTFPCTSALVSPSAELPRRGEELLLFNGRFRVEVTWVAFDGSTISGQPTALLDRAGYFSFLGSSNPELVVKITPDVDQGFHTLVAGAANDLEYELIVTDLCNGDVQTYTQPLGTMLTIVDEQAFPIECSIALGL